MKEKEITQEIEDLRSAIAKARADIKSSKTNSSEDSQEALKAVAQSIQESTGKIQRLFEKLQGENDG